MPQALSNIPLQLSEGPVREAVAVGNNAAWRCPCDRNLPLLGRTHASPGQSPVNYRVVCPDCGRQYIVDPADSTPHGGAVLVRELSSSDAR